MKRILFFITFMVMVFTSTGVFAANPYKWTGFYAGLQGSFNVGSSDWDNMGGINGNNVDHTLTGGMGGLFLGFNYQTPIKIVVGFVTDFNGGEISGSSSCPNNSYTCHTEITWDGSTRVRVGYAFNRFLPYLGIGAAYTYVHLHADGPTPTVRRKGVRFGTTPCLGVDFVIVKNLIARAEAAYYSYGSQDVRMSDGSHLDNTVDYFKFKLGLAWKF